MLGGTAACTGALQHNHFRGAHQGGNSEQSKGGDDGLGGCLKLLEDGLPGGQLCAQGCDEACSTIDAGNRMGVTLLKT
jgi:hypothetical protein